MKRYSISIIYLIITLASFAQSPQSFQYQAVVRDVSGAVLVNQSVSFQLSIISGTLPGTVEYVETHSATTNAFGIVTLVVGNGTPVTNLFSDIDWSINPHFIKVEIDLGSGYVDMGTTQLLSVPYALYSENAGNIPVYTGGSGIDVTGTTITNTSPDQILNLIQGGATTITGTYPNYEISSTDLNTGTPGGQNTSIQYNNTGVFAGDTASLAWDYTNKRLGVGISNPLGRVVIKGSATASDTLPLFEIKNKLGEPVFIVYPDSVHFYIKDDSSPSNRGGFAVSGRSNAKAGFNDYLKVRPDSTRIYTGDAVKGFGVRNINGANKTSYMQLNPDNYFIGHESGIINSGGLYNSFIGYNAGRGNISGSNNIFVGYKSGINNQTGSSNVSLGNNALYTNNGTDNIAIGTNSLYLNTSGNYNVAIGTDALYSNTYNGNNIAIGYTTLKTNTTGWNNAAIGNAAMYYNTTGPSNSALGEQALYHNTTGGSNVAIGNLTLYYNNGSQNTAVGTGAFFSFSATAYNNSTALGANSVISTSNKVRLGNSTVTVIEGQVAYTFPSDGRFKNNVTEEVKGLDFINRLRPIVYNFDTRKFDDFLLKDMPDSIKESIMSKNDYSESSSIRQTGFIAQEVVEAAKESGYSFNGVHQPINDKDNYSVAYSLFTVPLVKAVQELNAKNILLENDIQAIRKENAELKNKFELLKTEIEKLKKY